MSESNRFGRIVSPWQIEQATAATIALWINDYLGELGRLHRYDPAQIEPPRAIITRSEFERWSEEQIPAVIVMCGPTSRPERHAQGQYMATWPVGVSVVVSDQDQDATRKLALTYITAIRALILQHKMLKSSLYPSGLANYSTWEGEDYDTTPSLAERSIGSAHVMFSIGIEGAVTEQAGPRTPSASPWVDPGDWPLIEEVDVNVTPVALGDPVA